MVSVDPVCGMDVKEDGSPMAEYQGSTYYFCCESCKTVFIKDPEKHLSKDGHTGKSHGHHDHSHGGHPH